MNNLSTMPELSMLPWIEKYRPMNLDNIVSHERIIKTLKQFISKNEFPHVLFYGPPGTGKCLAYNTPILMYDGTIKMVQNIKKNDILMGDDNTKRIVMTTTKGYDIMYKVKQENGSDYIVNSDHIISLKLTKCFIEKYSNNKYYLLWFENHKINIKIFSMYNSMNNYKNILINEKKCNNIGDICDISIKNYIKQSSLWKKCYKGFKTNQINCWKKKNVFLDPYIFGYILGYNKYDYVNDTNIMQNYKINDVETRLNVIAGYIDANGIIINNKILLYHQSKNILDDILFIIRSLGIKVSSIKTTMSNNIIYYHIMMYNNEIKIPTKNKNISITNKLHNINTYKITIEKLNYDTYYGFEIDGNKRFILGDFTVTHNTSVILACAKEIYKDYPSSTLMVMEINASEERGIEIVRNQITQFAISKSILFSDDNNKQNMYKLIILDEADAMTPEAQASLRKIIEKYTSNVRFCLICNYIKKINIAIQSRCICFRFPPIKKQYIDAHIKNISKLENIVINQKGIDTIIKRSNGDMRKVLNILQSISLTHQQIDDELVNKCTGYPTNEEIINLIKSLLHESYENAYEILKKYKNIQGYSLIDIISEIHEELINSITNTLKINKLDNIKMCKIISMLGIIENNIVNSTNEQIHLPSLISAFTL